MFAVKWTYVLMCAKLIQYSIVSFLSFLAYKEK